MVILLFMTRPKAFDRDRALTRALELFQAKGYEATSIQDLLDAMGIGRQSLYDTFGDKEALYHEALERYVAEGPLSILVALESPLPLRRAVSAVLEGVVAHLASPGCRPCFIAHAALDRASSDGWTAQCVRNGYQDYLRLWEQRFRRAQAEGDLGRTTTPGPWGWCSRAPSTACRFRPWPASNGRTWRPPCGSSCRSWGDFFGLITDRTVQ